jgi:3-oxoacyl-[acyl-carrier protein] reductase
VNLRSVMHTCVRLRNELTSTRGSIVSLGSVACFSAVPHRPSYSAAKGGLLTLTKSLASAWAATGVRVNGIAPGYVSTRMTLSRRQDAQRYQQTLSRIPMGRWGEPAEIASIALFLASPMASYVTGQMISADGGIGL